MTWKAKLLCLTAAITLSMVVVGGLFPAAQEATGTLVGRIILGSTGVELTTDADGAWTWQGRGDGEDEDLSWNLDDVADTVGVASGSGVTSIDFQEIAVVGNRNAPDVDGATTFAITSPFVVLTCTGTETIDTITGGIASMVLIIEHGDTDCTLNDDDAATAADAFDLTGTASNIVGKPALILTLYYNGTFWLQIGESDNTP